MKFKKKQTEKQKEDVVECTNYMRLDVLKKVMTLRDAILGVHSCLNSINNKKLWAEYGYISYDEYCNQELRMESIDFENMVGSFERL